MINQRTLASLAVLVQSGKLDPVALVAETLTRIEDHPDRSIFVALTQERAAREAKAASARIKTGRSLGCSTACPSPGRTSSILPAASRPQVPSFWLKGRRPPPTQR